MKYLFISSKQITLDFEETILPLLSRMSNLEELHLYFQVHLLQGFIDELYLKRNLLPRLPRLIGMSVFIQSYLFLSLIPSSFSIAENLEKSSRRSSNGQLISYADYFPEAKQVKYNLYSLPSLNPCFHGISNRFLGGRFNYVREVTLYDEKPFECEFFVRIEKSFPLMEQLFVINHKAQERQRSDELTNPDRTQSPISYVHLSSLHLVDVHQHYIEQFLLDSICNYIHDFILYVKDESLQRFIDHFSKDQIRFNSNKVTQLHLRGEYLHSHCFEEYFPRAKISRQFYFTKEK